MKTFQVEKKTSMGKWVEDRESWWVKIFMPITVYEYKIPLWWCIFSRYNVNTDKLSNRNQWVLRACARKRSLYNRKHIIFNKNRKQICSNYSRSIFVVVSFWHYSSVVTEILFVSASPECLKEKFFPKKSRTLKQNFKPQSQIFASWNTICRFLASRAV